MGQGTFKATDSERSCVIPKKDNVFFWNGIVF